MSWLSAFKTLCLGINSNLCSSETSHPSQPAGSLGPEPGLVPGSAEQPGVSAMQLGSHLMNHVLQLGNRDNVFCWKKHDKVIF